MNLTKICDFGSLRGRGLVAVRSLVAGELLFEESPLISCQFSWNKLYGYLACDHCLKPLEDSQNNVRRLSNQPSLILPFLEASFECSTIYECSNCTNARYCSEECLHIATSQYHGIMCVNNKKFGDTTMNDNPLIKLDEIWRNFHFPPETCTIFLLVRLVSIYLSSYVLNNVESTHIVDSLDAFLSNTTELVENERLCHKLLGEQFVLQIDIVHKAFVDVIHYLVDKLMITNNNLNGVKIIDQYPVLQTLMEKNTFLNLLCLIGRNGQGIATSPLKLWLDKAELLAKMNGQENELTMWTDKLYDAMDAHVSCSFLDSEGVGLYKYQSK